MRARKESSGPWESQPTPRLGILSGTSFRPGRLWPIGFMLRTFGSRVHHSGTI